MFLLADSAIIGHLGTAELAGFGVASALLLNAMYLCIFLAFGTTASVARHVGAGDIRAALNQGTDGLWLALGIGLVLAGASLPLAPALVDAFGASAAAAPHAIIYLQISLLGLPAMLLVLAATGALRGLQEARRPMLVAVLAAATNAALNVALVYGFGLGVAGSALGTVITQWAAAGWLVGFVIGQARRHEARLRPERRGVVTAAFVGFPLLVRTVTLRVALLSMTYVATSQGDVALASHQLAFTLWSLLAIASDALAVAAQALVGRYLGAADVDRARAVTRRMIALALISGVLIGILIVVLRPAYIPAFTTDQEVRDLLGTVMLVVAATQPVGSVVFALDGVLIGSGDGRYLAVAGFWTMCAFLPLAWLVWVTEAGLVALWWALAGFLLARLVANLLRERSDAWLVPGATR